MSNLKYKIGDIVRVIDNHCSHLYLIGQEYQISKIYNETRRQYLLGRDSYVEENEIEFVFKKMRRTIQKGSLVKVISKPDVYFDLDEKVKELGGSEKWAPKFTPKIGDFGDVIGIDDGYVLVDFGSAECLLDIACLDGQKRKEEVQFLVVYPNNTLEEFSTETEMEKRLQELHVSQSIKPGDMLRAYNVKGYREIKLKISVAFT